MQMGRWLPVVWANCSQFDQTSCTGFSEPAKRLKAWAWVYSQSPSRTNWRNRSFRKLSIAFTSWAPTPQYTLTLQIWNIKCWPPYIVSSKDRRMRWTWEIDEVFAGQGSCGGKITEACIESGPPAVSNGMVPLTTCRLVAIARLSKNSFFPTESDSRKQSSMFTSMWWQLIWSAFKPQRPHPQTTQRALSYCMMSWP